MKNVPYIAAAVLISLSGAIGAGAAENLAISRAGLSLAGIETPAPQTPKSNMWLTLRKIQVNTAAPEMNDTLVGLLDKNQDAYEAVRELTLAGFKVKSYQSNTGGYMVFADVTGEDAADWAIGLARYYYITEVRVGQKVYDRLFGTRNKTTYAVKQGTLKGVANYGPVDLKLNKLDWTITGLANNAVTNLVIDHQEMEIRGAANNSPVDLKFDWSTEQVTVHGNANRRQVRYTVNWEKGLLEGYAAATPVSLRFDMGEGSADVTTVNVRGSVGHSPVDLTYNKVTGRLGGYMNYAPVDMTLVNCDLYDFLQYFFMFMKDSQM